MDPGSDPAQARGELLGATDLTAASSTPPEQSSPLLVPGSRAPKNTPAGRSLSSAGEGEEMMRAHAVGQQRQRSTAADVQAVADALDRLRVNGESAAGARASGDGAGGDEDDAAGDGARPRCSSGRASRFRASCLAVQSSTRRSRRC